MGAAEQSGWERGACPPPNPGLTSGTHRLTDSRARSPGGHLSLPKSWKTVQGVGGQYWFGGTLGEMASV